MMNEREIKILMEDNCTRAEAEKHLNNGTVVYADFEEHFETYMSEWDADEEMVAEYKAMIETQKPAKDWGVVEYEGTVYYIQYSL